MDNKTKTYQLVLIAQLKAKGFNDNTLFNQILRSSKYNAKKINTKYRKQLSTNYVDVIGYITRSVAFKNSLPNFQNYCINTVLDKVLTREFRNNKSNVKFQSFILKINNVLLESKKTNISVNLRLNMLKTYQIIPKDKPINVKRTENKELQEKVRTIKNLLDLIEYYNYQINTRSTLLNLRSKTTRKQRIVKSMISIHDYLQQNTEIISIFKQLKLSKGLIENKLLLNEIKREINAYKNRLYLNEFGISYSDKTDAKDNFYLNALGFELSGKPDKDNYDLNQLGLNIIYCHSNPKELKLKTKIKGNNDLSQLYGYKAYLNYMNNNQNITIIDSNETLNPKLPKYYIIYKYTVDADKIDRIYLKVLKTLNSLPKPSNDNNQFINYTLDFTYLNKEKKFDAYKSFYSKFTDDLFFSKIFLPTFDNDRFLYCSFGHPTKKEITKSKIGRNGLTFKYKEIIDTLGNLKPTNPFRNNMHRGLMLLLEYFDRTTNIKDFYKYNKKQILSTLRIMFTETIADKTSLNYILSFLLSIQKKIFERTYLIDNMFIRLTKEQINNLRLHIITNKISLRSKEGIEIKHNINRLQKKLTNYYVQRNILVVKHTKITRFNKEIKTNKLRFNSVIYDIMINQINKFYEITTKRLVNSQRTKNELILLALNNSAWNIIEMDYIQNTLHQIENNFENKFDELLTDRVEYEEITEVNTLKIFSLDFCKAVVNIFNHLSKTDKKIYRIFNHAVNLIGMSLKPNLNKEFLILNSL